MVDYKAFTQNNKTNYLTQLQNINFKDLEIIYNDDMLKFIDIIKFTFTDNCGLIYIITDNLNINFWDIYIRYFNALHKTHQLYNYNELYKEFIVLSFYVIENIDEINRKYNVNNYVKLNKYFIVEFFKLIEFKFKYNTYYRDPSNSYNKYKISLIIDNLELICKNAFDLELWQTYINICINVSPFKIDKLLNTHKWVLFHIKKINYDDIYNELTSRIDYHHDKDKENKNEFRDYCFKMIELLRIMNKIVKININNSLKTDYYNFIKNNFNKIIIIHNILDILKDFIDIYNITDLSIFIITDSEGFHALFDCLRYGDFMTCKWYINDILSDNEKLLEALNNVLNTNFGFNCIIQNNDYRILKLFLDVIEEKISDEDVKQLTFNLAINDYKITNFTKKINMILSFSERKIPHVLKSGFSNTTYIEKILYIESHINNTNFKPFILNRLKKINENNRVIIDKEIYNLELHDSYINFSNIKDIIDLTDLKNFANTNESKAIEIIYNFILNNILNICYKHSSYLSNFGNNSIKCLCKFTNLVINIFNYVFDNKFKEKFEYNNKNVGMKEVLEFLNTYKFTSCFNSINQNNIIDVIHNLRISTSNHCGLSNNVIDINISYILKILQLSTEKQLNLGMFSFFNNYKNYINMKDTIIYLFKNNVFFEEVKHILCYKCNYYIFNNNEDKYKIILNSYYYNNTSLDTWFKDIKLRKFQYLKTIYNNNLIIINLSNIFQNKLDKINDKNTHTNENNKHSNHIIKETIKYLKNFRDNLLNEINMKNTKYLDSFIDSITFKKSRLDKKNIELLSRIINMVRLSIINIKKDYDFIIFISGVLRIKLYNKKRVTTAFETHNIIQHKLNYELTKKTDTNMDNEILNTIDIDSICDLSIDSICDKNSDNSDFDKNMNNLSNNNNNKKSITRPHLLSVKTLLENYKKHNVITEKIDGVTIRNINLNNCFPVCKSNNIYSYNFDIEYEKNDNVHFIIGLNNSTLFNEKTFTDVISDLRYTHEFTKNNEFPRKITLDDLKNGKIIQLLIKEKNNYNKYIEISKSKLFKNTHKKLWWPKIFFELEYTTFNEYIQILKIFENNVLLKCFKNDGWILMHNKYLSNNDPNNKHKEAFKIKNREDLTIDIEFNDGDWYIDNKIRFSDFCNTPIINKNILLENRKIYRCYPIFESNNDISNNTIENINDNNYDYNKDNNNKLIGFEPREIRNDRPYPNPSSIVREILQQINNYVSFKDIYITFNKSKGKYYTLDIDNKIYSQKQKYKFHMFDLYLKGNIIDIGGGYKTKYYIENYKHNINSCISTDNDINLVINNIIDNNDTNNITFGYLDFIKENKEYTKICNQLKITQNNCENDTILAMNCINFALDSPSHINKLMKNLELISKNKTKIIIRFMDLDIFIKRIADLNLNSENSNVDANGTIKIKSTFDSSFININIKEKHNRIYYKWAHMFPVNEKVIGKTELTNIFELYNWVYKDYEYHPKYKSINSSSSFWEIYFKCFSIIVFEYNNI